MALDAVTNGLHVLEKRENSFFSYIQLEHAWGDKVASTTGWRRQKGGRITGRARNFLQGTLLQKNEPIYTSALALLFKARFNFPWKPPPDKCFLVPLTLENTGVDYYNILFPLFCTQWGSSPCNHNDSTTGSTTTIWVSRHWRGWDDTSPSEKWKILLDSPAHFQAPKVPLSTYQSGARKDNLSPERQPRPCRAPRSDVPCCLHQDNRHRWEEGGEAWCLLKHMFKLR